jgi:ParB family transcriptional regulator, chromosome partitioning protein
MSKVFSTSPLILGVIEDIESNLIRPFKYNYRYDVGDLYDLSHSIREKGLLQPILVRNIEETCYEIIAGHRRYEACKKLGWKKIICHIIELDDKDAFEVSLIENVQRKSLNPIEEAEAYKKYVLNFGWGGISDLAMRIGKSPSYIDKRLRLLDLPATVIDSVFNSLLNPSTAEELLSLKNKKEQYELANFAHANSLSTRDIREIIKDIKRNSVYDYGVNNALGKSSINDIDKKTQRCFDKSIIALRIAMNKLSSIIEETQENWIIYEILMHHKNMLHNEIDLLIKEKMKL